MSQGGNTTTSTKAESEHLASLRRLAQEHLQEIGEQEEKERLEDQEVKRVQEEEVMRRTKSRAAQPAAGAAETSPEKGSRMRTAQDVLDRIRWDPSYDVKAYIIGYLDRFGGVKEIHAPIWLDDSTEEDWVPQHRIRYFKKLLPGHGEEIVWHRFERIDKVFGSTAAPPT